MGIKIKIPNENIAQYVSLGYEITNPGAKKSELQKRKTDQVIFENLVWNIFYKMGFDYLNDDNSFFLDLNGNTKQIDVLAVDEETIIAVECKCADRPGTSKDFKTEIEAINGYKESATQELLRKFPGREVKFCFATKNYSLCREDVDRLKTYHIANFEYETVSYYKDLTNYLGTSAKYQFQGSVFSKERIDALNGNKIPAIKGVMGSKTYYMFAIEPKKLLKLAYILHRHTANIDNFPTYQRIIKKERLLAVTKYIKEGGYFPNSLIISIDGEINFDPISSEDEFSSQVGILELPNTYSSMYVIDGQHRLYGFSDKSIETADVIPVVAFADMNKEEQVKIFMDINENQKAVSKALRNTLIVDLNWGSDDKKKAQEALMIKIAESLGESPDSPLYGRVKIGESTTSDLMTVTTEMIKNAIKDSKFLNVYNKQEVKDQGTFDKNDNNATIRVLLPFIKKSLGVIRDKNIVAWNTKDNIITRNTAVYSEIRIINDIVNIKLKEMNIALAPDNIFDICNEMISSFSSIFATLDHDTISQMKQFGDGGKKKAYEALAMAFNSRNPSFTFPELETIIDMNSTRNNEESGKMIGSIERALREMFKHIFDSLGDKYSLLGNSVTTKIFSIKSEHDRIDAMNMTQTPFNEWDCVSFNEMVQIIKNGSNWSNYLQKELTTEEFQHSKPETMDWLLLLNGIKYKVETNKPIVNKDFEKLKEIYKTFVGEIDETNN